MTILTPEHQVLKAPEDGLDVAGMSCGLRDKSLRMPPDRGNQTWQAGKCPVNGVLIGKSLTNG